ncbi:MAG TPA: hypothetical protein VKJ45_26900 [Blastocatellia bacterium]|nr:hypothetical protein [Blastocatellia bacterium]
MARLHDLQAQIELEFSLLAKEYDPFQLDLEWFKYELAVTVGQGVEHLTPAAEAATERDCRLERQAVRGKINRKDLAILLSRLDDLIMKAQDMRYEPYDLNFYLEWKIETPHVYSIVTWFDMALSPRDLQARFPTVYAGFRFLVEEDSLLSFRAGIDAEFLGGELRGREEAPGLIN